MRKRPPTTMAELSPGDVVIAEVDGEIETLCVTMRFASAAWLTRRVRVHENWVQDLSEPIVIADCNTKLIERIVDRDWYATRNRGRDTAGFDPLRGED